MAGDALGQSEKAAQKLLSGMAEFLEVHQTFGPAEHGAEGDEEDVDERVRFGAVDARICDDGEVENPAFGMRFFGIPRFSQRL